MALSVEIGYPDRFKRSDTAGSFTQGWFFDTPALSPSHTSQASDVDDEEALEWVASGNLGSSERLHSGILENRRNGGSVVSREIEVRKLRPAECETIIGNLFKGSEHDNEVFLKKIRNRVDRVGVRLPTVEVLFQNLTIEAKCYVGTRALPTLWNATRNLFEGFLSYLGLSPTEKVILTILKDISGIIGPSRMTLLLGPPGSGKTTMLLALAGRLDPNLRVNGDITYNGHGLDEFVPQKTSSYVSQEDLHLGEMTVRETLEFSSRCQGVGARHDILLDIARREKAAGISPDPDIDQFMKATAMRSVSNSVQTEYILKTLGLDHCADTIVGDEMIRGVSGGQRKRVTTGEMIVGPSRTLFMDEISTGLDSSTTYQIVKCLGQFAHYMQGTIFMSLLQPAPETYELFDDVVLLSEGRIVYQGPREHVLEFFEGCGFKCPERKGTADFLQEVTSRKDQEQYWFHKSKPYQYISAKDFSERFQQFHVGKSLDAQMLIPSDRAATHKTALTFTKCPVKKTELLKACLAREVLLIRRNMFVFVFKTVQIVVMALIAMTVFLRTRMHENNEEDGSYFLGALFFSLVINMFNGYSEVSFVIFRLPVFFKQRDLLFYPSWAFTLPTFLVRLPISVVEAGIWVVMTYYVMGFAPEAGRFFRQCLVIFLVHQMSSSLFRLIGGICRTMVIASTGGSLTLLIIFMLGGFILPRDQIPKWWIWGYWVSPLTYAENAITVNEMLASRWAKPNSMGTTLGIQILNDHGIFTQGYWYWLGAAALLGFSLLFNVLFTVVLAYINPPGRAQAAISKETLSEHEGKHRSAEARLQLQTSSNGQTHSLFTELEEKNGSEEMQHKSIQLSTEISSVNETIESLSATSQTRGMILPFKPLIISFQEIKYSVDIRAAAREHGSAKTKLQLLRDVTGVFRPGVLTALMGVSGAGKTTLMDVLAGRKTGGYIEGDIRISGFPKRQETFARISGYCEQTDIHSPQVTVYESLIFSAWLRLSPEISAKNKMAFVDEVMELVELDSLRDALVGVPGMTGLSTEQRKRLTIAVELVANPSIIFMDEPTSGLDARAAAIVMRTVRNTVDTGRTVVCTIHQPSIDIFESFDELLLLKQGGQVIYAGQMGDRSVKVTEYFQVIPGVPKMKDGYNPATWMLEVTSLSMEAQLGIDFAEMYRNSDLCQQNKALVKELSQPTSDSKDLSFATEYSQPYFEQVKCCMWKQWLTYWRTPDYNCVRFFYALFCALIFASIFWDVGQVRKTEQDLLNVLGAMYGAVMFLGITNCSTVQPVVAIERSVFYREKAAGMYSATPYALAQVLIEIPYTLLQTIIYGCIVYSTMNFPWSPAKFFWFLFMMFFTFLYFTYYGMLAVSITPNHQLAAIIASTFYSLFNLFSGFFIPRPKIPGWWIWYYWICPVAWTVYGLVTSQYGDVEARIDVPGGNTTQINVYLEEHLGYRQDFLGVVAVVLVGFSVFFAFMYAFCIKYLNFQQR